MQRSAQTPLAAALVIVLLASGHVGHAADCCQIELVRQSDGGIIDVGVLSTGGAGYFAVSKRTPEGTLDPSFGVDGVTEPIDGLPPGGPSVLTVLPDDKIVVAAETGSGGQGTRLLLVRYNADGSLDTEFGEGGFIVGGTFLGSV